MTQNEFDTQMHQYRIDETLVKAQMDADSANAADLSVIINSAEYRI